MNFVTIIGFAISIVVLYIGLKLSTDNLMAFWDVPSIFIVFGGTFAATAVCFQLTRFMSIVKIFLRRVLFGKKNTMPNTIKEILVVAEAYKKGENTGEIKK